MLFVDQVHTVVAFVEQTTTQDWDSDETRKAQDEVASAVERRWRHLGDLLGVKAPVTKRSRDAQLNEAWQFFGFA